MLLLWAKIKGWAIAVGGFFLAVLAALAYGYRKGDKAGANSVEVKSAGAANKAVEQKNKIENEVQGEQESDVKKKLEEDWSR